MTYSMHVCMCSRPALQLTGSTLRIVGKLECDERSQHPHADSAGYHRTEGCLPVDSRTKACQVRWHAPFVPCVRAGLWLRAPQGKREHLGSAKSAPRAKSARVLGRQTLPPHRKRMVRRHRRTYAALPSPRRRGISIFPAIPKQRGLATRARDPIRVPPSSRKSAPAHAQSRTDHWKPQCTQRIHLTSSSTAFLLPHVSDFQQSTIRCMLRT